MMSENNPSANRPVHPGQHLRLKLQEKGWTQNEFATIIGRSRQAVIDILTGKTGITAEMAIALSAAFDTSADYWMKLNSEYRLSRAEQDREPIATRAALYDRFPIKDMQRRGWIRSTRDSDEIESELKRFFSVPSLDTMPAFPISARKVTRLEELSPAQRAWCFRARQLAGTLPVNVFRKERLPALRKELKACAVYLRSATKLPKLLSEAGIRFVVVEPLPGAKIDGATFWLKESAPVIAVSIRYDRIDAFWFTVMHEFAHVEAADALSIDSDLAGEDAIPLNVKADSERAADAKAAASLVPPEELDSFIRRIGPLYSKERIIQFAHRIKMHPGIIVGQLQYLGEIGYSANREMLVKVRKIITEVARTDGWGRTIGTL